MTWFIVQYDPELKERGFPLVYKDSFSTCLLDGSGLCIDDVTNGRFPAFDSWDTFGVDMYVTAQLLKFWKDSKPRALHPRIHTTPKAFEKDPLQMLDYGAMKYFLDGTQHLYLDRALRLMDISNYLMETDVQEYDCGLPLVLLSTSRYLSRRTQTQLAHLLRDFDVAFSMCEHSHHARIREKACASAVDAMSYCLTRFGVKLCSSLIFQVLTLTLHISLIMTDYGDYAYSPLEVRPYLHLIHRLCTLVPWVQKEYRLEVELIYRLLTRRCFTNPWICDQSNFYWSASEKRINDLRFLHCSFELLCTSVVCTLPLDPSTRPANLMTFTSLNECLQYVILPDEVQDVGAYLEEMQMMTRHKTWILCEGEKKMRFAVSSELYNRDAFSRYTILGRLQHKTIMTTSHGQE